MTHHAVGRSNLKVFTDLAYGWPIATITDLIAKKFVHQLLFFGEYIGKSHLFYFLALQRILRSIQSNTFTKDVSGTKEHDGWTEFPALATPGHRPLTRENLEFQTISAAFLVYGQTDTIHLYTTSTLWSKGMKWGSPTLLIFIINDAFSVQAPGFCAPSAGRMKCNAYNFCQYRFHPH